jgi:hypothetical protein|nr:MAG TPA: replisome organizer [Caudoviricetes sp.]
MPTRLIREGILTSERIASLSWEAEVFYRRLMSVADDYGLYDARPAILRSALYPLQLEKMSECNIQRCLAACEAAGLILLFARNGKSFLQIRDFGQQIKSKPKYPLPSDADLINPLRSDTERYNPSPSVTNRNESLPPVTKSETNTESYTNTKTNADTNSNEKRKSIPGKTRTLPLSADEVKNYLQGEVNRSVLCLFPRQIDDCALQFWADMEGCGWVDYKMRPVNNWQATALSYALRWSRNNAPLAPGGKKGNVRMDTNDLGIKWE